MSEVHKALLAAQMQMPSVAKTAVNPFYHSKYAPLDEVYATVIPVLNANGLVYNEWVRAEGQGDSFLMATITHAESGEALQGSYWLVPEKNTPQGMGIAITYARRYLLQCMAGVTPEDDTDGEGLREKGQKQPAQEKKVPKSVARDTGKGWISIEDEPEGMWDTGEPTSQLPNVKDTAHDATMMPLWKETRATMIDAGMGDFLTFMREKHVGSKRNCTDKQYQLISGLVDTHTEKMHGLVLSVLAGEAISGDTLIGGDMAKILIDTLYKKSDSYDETKAAKMSGNLALIASKAGDLA